MIYENSVDLLNRVQAKMAERNPDIRVKDADIARALGVTRGAVASWRKKRNVMSPEAARRAAEILGEPAEPIIVSRWYEAEEREELKAHYGAITRLISHGILERVKKHGKKSGAAVAMMTIGAALLAAGMIHASPENLAAFPLLGWSELYIMRTQMRRIRSLSFEFCGPPDLPLQRRWAVVGNV